MNTGISETVYWRSETEQERRERLEAYYDRHFDEYTGELLERYIRMFGVQWHDAVERIKEGRI